MQHCRLEHLHVDGRPDQSCDVLQAAILFGARRVPRVENGVDRLRARVRERLHPSLGGLSMQEMQALERMK
eukprot:6190709-Pleurochrysis_carterae.AAC.3